MDVRMLDLAGILFSSLMIMWVILRALQMDRARPWFQPVRQQAKPAVQRAWQRRK
jgi:hypothetical protein